MIAAATILVGCNDHVEDHAAPGSSTPSSMGAKPTLPEYFPDLAAYPEADHQVFEMRQPQAQGFAFSTPDGLTCSNNAYPEPEWEVLKCFGSRPDEGPGIWTVEVRARGNAPATTQVIPVPPDAKGPPLTVYPPLKPGQKVTALKGASVCGMTNDGAVACHLGDHGFVLTPTATKLF